MAPDSLMNTLVVTFLDGHQLQLAATDWTVDGPVFRAGTFAAPITHIRCWETLQPPSTPELETSGEETREGSA